MSVIPVLVKNNSSLSKPLYCTRRAFGRWLQSLSTECASCRRIVFAQARCDVRCTEAWEVPARTAKYLSGANGKAVFKQHPASALMSPVCRSRRSAERSICSISVAPEQTLSILDRKVGCFPKLRFL
jgi:hypothetical protein